MIRDGLALSTKYFWQSEVWWSQMPGMSLVTSPPPCLPLTYDVDREQDHELCGAGVHPGVTAGGEHWTHVRWSPLPMVTRGHYTPAMFVQKLAPRLRRSTRPEPRLVGVAQMVSGYSASLHSHTTLIRIEEITTVTSGHNEETDP